MIKVGSKVIVRTQFEAGDTSLWGEDQVEMIGKMGAVYAIENGIYARVEFENNEKILFHVDKLKEANVMKKEDLRTFHIVETREGAKYMIFTNLIPGYGDRFENKHGYGDLANYNEDLTHKSRGDEGDIVKVFAPHTIFSCTVAIAKDWDLDKIDKRLIWEREDTEKEKAQKVINELRLQLKAAEEKLASL